MVSVVDLLIIQGGGGYCEPPVPLTQMALVPLLTHSARRIVPALATASGLCWRGIAVLGRRGGGGGGAGVWGFGCLGEGRVRFGEGGAGRFAARS